MLLRLVGSAVYLLSFPFRLLAVPFFAYRVWQRNRAFDTGKHPVKNFKQPVIAIGSLQSGGCGKTPHLEYVLALLHENYKTAVTTSRGSWLKRYEYRLTTNCSDIELTGDVAMQLNRKFPDVTIGVCGYKAEAIERIIGDEPETEVFLVDDGYQLRSVRIGLNILLTPYHKPFYRDLLKPLGHLREPAARARRADAIIVTNCPEGLSQQQRRHISQRIKPRRGGQVYFSEVIYDAPKDFYTGETCSLKNRSPFLLSALSSTEHLQLYLKQQCSTARNCFPYPNHYPFQESDLSGIRHVFEKWKQEGKVMVTTEKDAVRLRPYQKLLQSWRLPILVLPIRVRITGDDTPFEELIWDYLGKSQQAVTVA